MLGENQLLYSSDCLPKVGRKSIEATYAQHPDNLRKFQA